MNTALILPPSNASFRRIAGLPLIQRTVLSALRSGFERVIVMPGDDGARLQQLLRRDRRSRSVELVADSGTNGIREGQVAVLPSDCLLTAATLNHVYDTRLNGRPILFTGSNDGESLVLCSASALAQLDGTLQSDAGTRALRMRALGAIDTPLNGALCARVTDDASARAAETRLLAHLRRETAETDGPLARLDRFVSQWISRRLVETPLRPNHITMIGTAIGLLGAWCLAHGTYAIDLIGALLFVVATIIDGCDGEVARLKFLETPFGQRFDIITDNIVHAAIFVALGLGQYRRHPDGHYVGLITLLLVGVALAAGVGYWCVLRRPEVARIADAPQTTRGRIRARILRGFEALMNRDFAYLILALALVDRVHWFLWGAAFGTYGFTAALLWVYRWRDAA